MAYLLRHREFWSLDVRVSPAVLVPRPETELLVQRALLQLVTAPEAEVADLGTGSGAIAIALARNGRTGTSRAPTFAEALEVARAMARRLAGRRVDGYRGIGTRQWRRARFDALVSNPPYIAENDPVLEGDGLRHEPRLRADAGR